jgi:Flp pilus assembly pilin Flp
MRPTFRKLAHRFLGDDKAPSMIEYALLVAGVGVLVIAVVYMLGGGTRQALEKADPAGPANTTSSSPSR